MKFIIKGKNYETAMENIINSMKNIDPEPVKIHYIKIGNKEYPIKQVISETLNIPRISFTSMYAYNILEKLGFKIFQK